MARLTLGTWSSTDSTAFIMSSALKSLPINSVLTRPGEID